MSLPGLQLVHTQMQAHLREAAGWVPDRHRRANVTAEWARSTCRDKPQREPSRAGRAGLHPSSRPRARLGRGCALPLQGPTPPRASQGLLGGPSSMLSHRCSPGPTVFLHAHPLLLHQVEDLGLTLQCQLWQQVPGTCQVQRSLPLSRQPPRRKQVGSNSSC